MEHSGQFSRRAVDAIRKTQEQGSIRRLVQVDPVKTVAAVRLQLQDMVKAYTGALSDTMYEELTKFVIASFPEIGVFEIQEAFRLAAAGSLEVAPAQMTAWYGQWTGMQLGTVLNAYIEYRKRVIAEFSKMESAAALPVKSKETRNEIKARRVSDLLSGQVKISISFTDYDLLEKEGYLILTDAEKRSLFETAIRKMEGNLKSDLLSEDQKVRDRARQWLPQIQNDAMTDEVFNAVKNMAKVMAVNNFIMQRKNGEETTCPNS